MGLTKKEAPRRYLPHLLLRQEDLDNLGPPIADQTFVPDTY